MIYSRVNRTDPEKIFVVAKNSYSTASLTDGQAVAWDYVTDADGVAVTLAVSGAAKHGGLCGAGIVSETIAVGAYGLIQVYGYHAAARVRSITGGAPAVATGIPLGLVSAVFCLEGLDVSVASSGKGRMQYPIAFSLAAATAGFTTTTGSVFIKALSGN